MGNVNITRLQNPECYGRVSVLIRSFLLIAILLSNSYFLQTASAVTRTWDNGEANDNWTSNNNWAPNGTEPEVAGDIAVFWANNNSAVDLNQNVTLSEIRFDDNDDWNITENSGETVTFNDGGGGDGDIIVTNANGNGAHTLAVGIILNDALEITQNSTGTFTMTGNITGNARNMDFHGSGEINLNGGNAATGVDKVDIEEGSTVRIDGGYDFTMGDELDVGLNGDGTLIVDGAGSSFNISGNFDAQFGTDGTAGAAATFILTNDATATFDGQFHVAGDSDSTALVSVGSGADLNLTNTSRHGQRGTGITIISGTGTTMTQENNGLQLGTNSAGNGLLQIEAGAKLTHTGGSNFKIGTNATGIGSVVITGAGTSAELKNALVGDGSTQDNMLVVSNSAAVTLTTNLSLGDDAGSRGTATVASGGSIEAEGGTRVGHFGTGTLVVTGSNTTFIQNSSNFNVGKESGAVGNFTLSAGAQLTSTGAGNDFYVGRLAGALGTATVSGAGTTALLHTLYVGDASANDNQMLISNTAAVTLNSTLIIADDANSNGTLSVTSGASVSTSSTVASGLGGTGSLVISGSNTTFTMTNATDEILQVGDDAGSNGYLEVSNGAVLETTYVSANLQIGRDSGSIGSALISGAGSTAIIGDVLVGRSSANDNEMVVSNTANLTVKEELYVGWAAGAKGAMTVQTGADVSVANTAFIGDTGTGSLTIDGAGSTFTATTVNVGNNAGSRGTLTLSNGGTIDATTVNLNQTGSSFTADTIAIGNAAAEIDTLNINAGTTATATTIDVGSGGTLNLNRSDGITGASNMLLSGGTFNTSGNDQAAGGLGTLTMSANSVIDVGAGAIINFAVLDETSLTGTLSIHNWSSGRHNGSGSDQLIFADHAGFLQSTHGLQVKFYSDGGSTLVGSSGYFIGNALVAAPEPGTWIGIGSLLVFAVWRERKRLVKIISSCNRKREN